MLKEIREALSSREPKRTLLLFAIYDNKAQAFNPPFATPAVGLALRMFEELANDKSSQVGKHPQDFSLYQVGTYDDSLGIVSALGEHVNLGLAANFVQQSN